LGVNALGLLPALRAPRDPVNRARAIPLFGLVALAFVVPCGADENSQTFADVKAVCTRCHTADAFLSTPRSWQRWNTVFGRMMEHGATGTDSQLAGVTEFFLSNLTIINVNTSPADEIEWVLNASPAVRDFIVERRENRKFTSLADLSSVPGIDQDRLRQLNERIRF
jgi:DNA uptake protein ComE-like DNA-binding protein